MPAQANANVIALQLEKVRDKVPLLYERDDILLTMIQQRGDVEKVSSRNMRLPLQVNPGGKAGSYNADGGDLGRGSGTQYDVAQISPIFFRVLNPGGSTPRRDASLPASAAKGRRYCCCTGFPRPM